MGAGDSAEATAARSLARATAHEAEAAQARAEAGRYSIAAAAERRVAAKLSGLSAAGYFLLPDRGWPGSRRAQVDLVLVGPSGVYIVDSKDWRDVSIEHGRVFRGDADVTEDLMPLVDLCETVETDLAEIGLAPGEVHPVAAFARASRLKERVGRLALIGEDDALGHVTRRGARLTPGQVDQVLIRCLALFPQIGAPAPVSVAIPEPVLPAPTGEIEITRMPTEADVRQALEKAALAAPIEEWMSFLDPEQAKTVRRSFSGPSRIRGAAGTGKTVVGLHRTAYLARAQPGPVLVTTFVKTLPAVLRTLLERMAPDEAPRVEFTNVHSWAKRVLDERGVRHKIDDHQSQQARNLAWLRTGSKGALARSVRGRDYWHEEIEYVIKGRGLTDFAQYADLVRTGRRYRLTLDQRRAVWDLYETYQAELRARDVIDWPDLITLAKAELEREPLERYAAVIVDEAQDLTCVQVQMLHSLVGDREDGLTLIGDGQQSIYPGGYTLAEAGVSVSGRAIVMGVNYRNTAEILSYASSLVAASEFTDPDGTNVADDAPPAIARSGHKPTVVSCGSSDDAERRAVGRVAHLVDDGTHRGDIGILCWTNKTAARIEAALRAAGHPTISLTVYDGRVGDAVKVGTVKRAKGLEFKHVLIPDARTEHVGSSAPPEDEGERERWELERREHYVAATRARDSLWIAVVSGA